MGAEAAREPTRGDDPRMCLQVTRERHEDQWRDCIQQELSAQLTGVMAPCAALCQCVRRVSLPRYPLPPLTHLLRSELLKELGEVPSSPLLSGGVAPISQPTELEGGDSPSRFLRAQHVMCVSVRYGLL
jgi:hypothetical protein